MSSNSNTPSSNSPSESLSSSETHLLLGPVEDLEKEDSHGKVSSDSPLRLRIKCNSPGVNAPKQSCSNSSTRDWFEICTSGSADVKTLKDQVKSAIGETAHGRYMRIIASGRLLAPDSAPLSAFKLNDEDYVHVVVAPVGVRGGQQAAMAQGASSSRHSGVGPAGVVWNTTANSDDEEEIDLESGATREWRGFDRLQSQGLTRDEISAIRLYFRPSVDEFVAERRRGITRRPDSEAPELNLTSDIVSSAVSTNSDDERQRRMERLIFEEEWMEIQAPTSEFRLNLNMNSPFLHRRYLVDDSGRWGAAATAAAMRMSSPTAVGNDKDFLWGFFLGFFVGFVMLFWVWMPTVPHKQKLGILTGISFQMALSMLRSSEKSEASTGNP